MSIVERMKVWKKLAQTTTETPATPAQIAIGQAPTISISQIPTFKANLFSNKTEFVQDIQLVINTLNKYLFTFSAGKLDFTATWRMPSVGPDHFTNSLKNIFSIAKWLYSVITKDDKPYSVDGLRKICKDLSDTVSNLDFPDVAATSFKSEIISLSQSMQNKLR